MSARDVVISGIGLVSALGEGVDAHRLALRPDVKHEVDATRFSPFHVYPLPPIDWSRQIPKRGDQRQMETWQRLGTYAAGLALEDAGLKNNEEFCARMDMVVAAGGGERDETVDNAILEAARTRNDRAVLLNEKLTTELRPTLFLAQLSNLLAGNISIVHKVTGSSRTFMGEEGAGISAVATAVARIRSGQSDLVLVGGAYNAEHRDMLLGYELGGHLHRGPWAPTLRRDDSEGGGVITGSGGAFLVLESREAAEKRGHTAYALLGDVQSARARRDRGELHATLEKLARRIPQPQGRVVQVSGASGAKAALAPERQFLQSFSNGIVCAFSDLTGHMKEAQFPFAVALSALFMRDRDHPAPPEVVAELGPVPPLEAALALTVGYTRGEGMALVSPLP
ncbi:MAG: beta-ketoacyl-ACP synthase [Mesorhizobium amorphae]|nr:MAG: beta-ketoacyl-ACP synthase [Mesorhizobium amorphae]